jgi:cytochrome P450
VLAEGFPQMPYIIEVDPPLHDRIRGLITKAFTPRRVAELEPRIEEIARELIDGFAADGSAEIVERFAWPLPLRVLGELFGVPDEQLGQLHHWGQDWLLLQQELPLEQRLAHARGLVELQCYFVELVEQRLEQPTDDLLGALVAARGQIDPPLSSVEIAGLPLDLMVAGHVTVTRAIGSTLNRLFAYPPLREHLLDPAVAPNAIEEILRLESPAQGLFRIATREVEIGGVTLQPGARVMAHFASANRDDCVFGRADEYEPLRDDLSKHLAFGKGIHFCIGAPLARLELAIALPMLLERLSGLRHGSEVGHREEVFFARGFRTLPVEWDA